MTPSPHDQPIADDLPLGELARKDLVSVSDWLDAFQERLKGFEDPGLLHHCRRMESLVIDLCLNWSVDPQRGRLALWAHDQLRMLSDEELMRTAEAIELEIGPEEREVPILLHGPVSASLLRRMKSFPFEDALLAVEYHTTLRADPSAMEMILYVVDKIEPGKKGRDNANLFQLAYRDLTESALRIAQAGLRWELQRGNEPHRLMREFIEWAEKRGRASE